MTKDEALRLALEVLKRASDAGYSIECEEAITAIKAALEAKDEPVAYGMWDTMIGKGNRMMYVRLGKGQDGCTVPLYTTPPQRKPLTKEEIDAIVVDEVGLDADADEMHNFARAIEAAHRIKE